MGLQERLDAMREGSRAKLPAEALATMKSGLETLASSGRREQALKVGDEAPDFSLRDGNGTFFTLRELVGEKPLVVNFYRGFW